MKASEVKNILSKNILADGFDIIMDLDKSQGSWVVDERDGSKHLDMFTMYASASIGYNHPKIHSMKDELFKASIHKPTLSDLYNTMFAECMETFDRIAVPEYLKHAFFIEGGALAVENALKIAFDWKVRKNLEKNISITETKIIHFKQAFHGRTGYTLSLTNTTDPRKTMYFPKFDWPRIDNPSVKFPLNSYNLEMVKKKEAKAIEQIKKALVENPNQIAGLIIEPIQGEGGDNHFRCRFFEKLKELSEENEFLLIYDEVQTGIGITGKMWAHQHFSPEICPCDKKIKKSPLPDIISFGKKTQVCGLLAGDRILEVDKNVFEESSRINSTFGGNLVDMVRFKGILELIEDQNLINHTKKIGDYLLEELEGLTDDYPGYVTNSRGLGLFCAFDLPSGTERDDLWKEMMNNNLLILPSGDQSIRFRPHLNVTKEDIDIAISIVRKSLSNCLK
ncbi:MAG: L-lysine 6-transaminase [Candidatus Marinimicrobia bacterium]|nr:L-lysine 6-transaminase [Candidatus Neomarinimicrobiota bacterium]